MSATMKAGFFLVILAGFFLPSAEQGSSTIATTSDSSTTVLITNANSEGSTAPEPITANATGSTAPEPITANATGSTAPEPITANATGSTAPEPITANATGSTAPEPITANATGSTAPEPITANATDSSTTVLITNANSEDPSVTDLITNASSEGSTATEPTTANTPVKSTCSSKPPPCGTGAATCVDIHDGYICRCPYSYYFDEKEPFCSLGKQFFGSITVAVPYSAQFTNVLSLEYKMLYDNVTRFFKLCFQNDTSYAETIITKITQTGVKSRSLKNAAGITDIEAINIFTAGSTITQANVTRLINNTRNDIPGFSVTVYKESNPCNSPLCDEATTTCNSTLSGTVLVCDCKAGYYSRLPFSKSCLDCELPCTVENKKECIQNETKEGLVPACQCLINHKPGASKDAPCVQCDYGYSGVHCENSFQLVLIIVGSIAGAFVLALLGGVIALSLKSKKADKSSDRERLIKPEDNAVFGSSQSTEVPQLPRVAVKPSTNTNKTSSANPYETDEPFQRTVPTRDYDDDTDSWFEMAPKNTAFGKNSKY